MKNEKIKELDLKDVLVKPEIKELDVNKTKSGTGPGGDGFMSS